MMEREPTSRKEQSNSPFHLFILLLFFFTSWGCKNTNPQATPANLHSIRSAYLQQYGETHNLMHFVEYLADRTDIKGKKDSLLYHFLDEIVTEKEGWMGINEETLEYFVKDFEAYFITYYPNSDFKDKIATLLSSYYINPEPNFAFNLQLNKLNGEKVLLREFIGKPVVLDFWATWCVPCMKQIPFFEKVKDEYKNEEVVFLTVNMDETTEKWKNFVEKKNPKYEITTRLPAGNEDRQATAIGVISLPAYLFVNKEGKLICADGPKPQSFTFSALINLMLSE